MKKNLIVLVLSLAAFSSHAGLPVFLRMIDERATAAPRPPLLLKHSSPSQEAPALPNDDVPREHVVKAFNSGSLAPAPPSFSREQRSPSELILLELVREMREEPVLVAADEGRLIIFVYGAKLSEEEASNMKTYVREKLNRGVSFR